MNTLDKMRYFYHFFIIAIDKKRRFLYDNIVNNSILSYGNIEVLSLVAQLAEQVAVNHWVRGSNPREGEKSSSSDEFFYA